MFLIIMNFVFVLIFYKNMKKIAGVCDKYAKCSLTD